MDDINESVESTRQLRSYSVRDYSAVILRPESFGPLPAIIAHRSFGVLSDDLDVQEKHFKKNLRIHLENMRVSLQII